MKLDSIVKEHKTSEEVEKEANKEYKIESMSLN